MLLCLAVHVKNKAVSQESLMIIYTFNRFRKDGRLWEKRKKEGYKINTTALFSWIILFGKKPKTLMYMCNRVNENKAGFWIFSACDVLGES